VQRIQLVPGFVQQVQQPCSHCGGKGKEVKKKCPVCKGNRVVRGESVIELEVEKGTKDGAQFVFEMEADESPELIPGDVILVVRTKNNELFRRRDDDLETTVRLSMREALLGFQRQLVHMDGHTVLLSRTGITPHGTRVKVPGEGMPKHHIPSEKGDLYVTYEFDLPRSLTAQQKEVLEEILE
jgi:DnaJ-class molecular chaperone